MLLGRQRGPAASVRFTTVAHAGATLLMDTNWSCTSTSVPAAFARVFSSLGAAGPWQQPGEAIRNLPRLLPDPGLSLPSCEMGPCKYQCPAPTSVGGLRKSHIRGETCVISCSSAWLSSTCLHVFLPLPSSLSFVPLIGGGGCCAHSQANLCQLTHLLYSMMGFVKDPERMVPYPVGYFLSIYGYLCPSPKYMLSKFLLFAQDHRHGLQ